MRQLRGWYNDGNVWDCHHLSLLLLVHRAAAVPSLFPRRSLHKTRGERRPGSWCLQVGAKNQLEDSPLANAA